jgi:hypothetical protein
VKQDFDSCFVYCSVDSIFLVQWASVNCKSLAPNELASLARRAERGEKGR